MCSISVIVIYWWQYNHPSHNYRHWFVKNGSSNTELNTLNPWQKAFSAEFPVSTESMSIPFYCCFSVENLFFTTSSILIPFRFSGTFFFCFGWFKFGTASRLRPRSKRLSISLHFFHPFRNDIGYCRSIVILKSGKCNSKWRQPCPQKFANAMRRPFDGHFDTGSTNYICNFWRGGGCRAVTSSMTWILNGFKSLIKSAGKLKSPWKKELSYQKLLQNWMASLNGISSFWSSILPITHDLYIKRNIDNCT